MATADNPGIARPIDHSSMASDLEDLTDFSLSSVHPVNQIDVSKFGTQRLSPSQNVNLALQGVPPSGQARETRRTTTELSPEERRRQQFIDLTFHYIAFRGNFSYNVALSRKAIQDREEDNFSTSGPEDILYDSFERNIFPYVSTTGNLRAKPSRKWVMNQIESHPAAFVDSVSQAHLVRALHEAGFQPEKVKGMARNIMRTAHFLMEDVFRRRLEGMSGVFLRGVYTDDDNETYADFYQIASLNYWLRQRLPVSNATQPQGQHVALGSAALCNEAQLAHMSGYWAELPLVDLAYIFDIMWGLGIGDGVRAEWRRGQLAELEE